MSVITPNTGSPTVSLSSPLITPGYPLVSVEKSNPVEHGTGKDDGVPPATKRQNAVHQAGHDSNRSL
jgi:hypothetical protein